MTVIGIPTRLTAYFTLDITPVEARVINYCNVRLITVLQQTTKGQ